MHTGTGEHPGKTKLFSLVKAKRRNDRHHYLPTRIIAGFFSDFRFSIVIFLDVIVEAAA